MPLIDIDRLLKRVVSDVFDSTIEVTYTAHPKYENDWRVALVSTTDRRREIELRATYEWFTAHIEELDVGTIVFAYDDDEKESELRDLALMAREYLEGEGYVRVKPRLFGRKGRTSLFIETDDTLWELGRRRSSIGPA